MNVFASQVRAFRAVAESVIAMADSLLEQMEGTEKAAQPCEHPQERRRPIPRMGSPGAWRCDQCGATGGEGEAPPGVQEGT